MLEVAVPLCRAEGRSVPLGGPTALGPGNNRGRVGCVGNREPPGGPPARPLSRL